MSLTFTPSNAFLVYVGLKRMTRRPRRDTDRPIRFPDGRIAAVDRQTKRGWRVCWATTNALIHGRQGDRTATEDFLVRNVHAIVPGRGKPSVGHLHVLRINSEVLTDITYEDAAAECGLLVPKIAFAASIFFALWDSIYGGGPYAVRRRPEVWAMEIAPACTFCQEPVLGLPAQDGCARCVVRYDWMRKASELLPLGQEPERSTGGST